MLGRLAFALLTTSAVGSLVATRVEARQPAATHTIIIDKMAFGAAPTNLHVGDTIIWVNRDLFQHSATAGDRSFNVDIAPGKSARIVLARAGIISFHCAYHPGMKGTLVIAPA
jgi:plastocyanin